MRHFQNLLYILPSLFMTVLYPYNANAVSLKGDIVITYYCNELKDQKDMIYKFLFNNNYSFVDRSYSPGANDSKSLFKLNIAGSNPNQTMIEFISRFPTQNRFVSTLTSIPPTIHNTELEIALQEFIDKELKCNIEKINLYKNSEESQKFFLKIYNNLRK